MAEPKTSDGTKEREFLSRLLSSRDQSFLVNVFQAIRDSHSDGGLKYVAAQGYELDLEALEKLKVGRNFNLGLAGGAYKFNSNPHNFVQLFVNSVTQQIFVDGKLSSSSTPYKIDDHGFVSFNIDHATFKVQFNCESLHDKDVEPSFKGTISNAGQDSEASGIKFYPWGNARDPMSLSEIRTRSPLPSETDPTKTKAAAEVISKAASKWIAVGFDLMFWKPKDNDTFASASDNQAAVFAMDGGGGGGNDGKKTAGLAVLQLVVASVIQKYTGAKLFGATAKSIEKKYGHFETSKITNFIRRGDIDPEVLKEPLQNKVKGLEEWELEAKSREKTIATITEYLRREYQISVKHALIEGVRSEYRAADLLIAVEFDKAFKSACEVKFDVDFGTVKTDSSLTSLYHAIDMAVENRLKRQSLPDLREQVYNLKNKWGTIQRRIGVEIDKLPKDLSVEDKQKRTQDIKNSYRSQLDELKEDQRRKQREIDAMEEGGENDKKFEERYKKVKQDVESHREQERRRQGEGK